ncbi:DNA phosphorothioation-associated putative methyltransferase [Pseudoalteromonas sp. S4498]|uniref:DNA phosphorothioation-associated putative methyltransferase n=1 Tax=Pseudoalteromonas galatheae TaxID=579562 RepID=UPI001108A8D0|nr:DNA phosphorothioation-associated putative methyltransferase [Pseudoalteromonas galatheae]NKC21480.1 DNA phosphorothioation-associated putative methyltransferase [Pseudoalteromonas galatheae]
MSTQLNFLEYKKLVKAIKVGKQLPNAVYVHHSAICSALPEELQNLFEQQINTHHLSAPWNVLKLLKRDFKITLLHYPDFDDYAYPALKHSITIDILESTAKQADYSKSDNPPILHRKEAFVLPDYPKFAEFESITKEGEAIGLYQNTKTIGFKKQWSALIKRQGYQLDEYGRLHPSEQLPQQKAESSAEQTQAIQRHLTAINRDRLSAPFQKLAKFGYLNGEYSIQDYGCGLGDDHRELEASGLNINAWDPVHKPEGQKVQSDIVNLGFVLNVIEDYDERVDTLRQAYALCDKLIVVSVMLTSSAVTEQFKPYKDGVITKRNTFQKYYSQAQIREFIEHTLNVKTVPFGQGIIAVFKCPELLELHHIELQFQAHEWQHITKRPTTKQLPTRVKQSLLEKHPALFEQFWQHCLHFGRVPANDEFEQSDAVRAIIASHNKAFELVRDHFDFQDFKNAQLKRKQDLLVYFALSLFGKRQAKSHLPNRLLRDIKSHFTSFNQAIDEARQLLFSISDPVNIGEACHHTYSSLQLGEFNHSHSYILPRTYLNQLPAVLRVYIGCAAQLYGDLDDIDLIKIHMRSGKITLLKYDDYNKKLPLLTERIKVKLAEQDIDYFYYGNEYPQQPLYNKIDFLENGSKAHRAQQRFDKKLADMLKGVPKAEWPNWNILLKVFEYWGVELKSSKFIKLKR